MADVTAQREARRRKITENSEARMNRLLGLTNKHHQSNESTSHSDNSSSKNSQPHSEQNEEQPKSLHLRSGNSTASTSPTSRNISSSPTSPPSSDRSSNSPDYFISGQDAAAVNFIPGDIGKIDSTLQTPFKRSEPEARRTDKLPKDTHRLNAQTFEILKIIIFIIVAFLQRCVLKYGLGLCLVPSIFVPFIVLEITFECVVYSYQQHVILYQSKGNMMSAALMLCGMKQELTDTYNKIMAHIIVWLSDVCLYIFAFIFWNMFIV